MIRDLRRRDVIRGIGAAGLTGLAGCTGGGSGGGSGRTIQLGLLMGVTGALEELGPPIRDAASLVPTQIDEADTAHEVQTQFEDTATSPSQGVSGAEALVNAGYPMICGALSSEVSLQVAQSVAIPNQTVMCSPASTSPQFTTLEDDDFFFRTAAPDTIQGRVLARIAADRIGAGSASVLALNNAYGNGLSQGFADAFEERGGAVTATASFSSGSQSYTSQIQSALEGDPDTMLIVAYPEDGVQIFRDFYSNFDRADMPILVSDGLQDSSLPGDVGQDMTNVSGTAPIGEGPGLDVFNDLYSEEFGSPEGRPFIRQAYDAAAVLVLANAAAGENDGPAVRDNVRPVTSGEGTEITPDNVVEGVELAAEGEAIRYRGVSGETEFDENGDPAGVAYEYFQFTSGGLEVVETVEP
jgi:ABC-type branched-subunit amino acid transport system substrate-binding protein